MINFIWIHVILPAIGFFFDVVPVWMWLIPAIVIAILLATKGLKYVIWFHTTFGWRGWASIAFAIFTLGVFRAGWESHRQAVLTDGDKAVNPLSKPITKAKKPVTTAKRPAVVVDADNHGGSKSKKNN